MREEMVRGSQRFEPTDERGGTLSWRVRVIRPGFRPVVEERSVRKDYHLVTAGMTNDEAACYGDSQARTDTVETPCPDCGQPSALPGHMDCPFPQDHAEDDVNDTRPDDMGGPEGL
jgi:hypothetical protein